MATILVVYSTISIILGTLMLSCGATPRVPAMYVFGDSLVDVGNNNYLTLSLAKANFPHNGIDYPGQKATGRFSNGKNFADLLAEKIGFATSQPPYLSIVLRELLLKSDGFPITGVNFASGGAGILNGSDAILKQAIPLSKQVEHYSAVHEDLVQRLGSAAAAEAHLSKSLFMVVIGSNDLLDYFKKGIVVAKNTSAQQLIDSMVTTFKQVLKKMYTLGARKYLITGTGQLGCLPSQRIENQDGECNEEANRWSAIYNQALQLMLKSLRLELRNEITYSYADSYFLFAKFVQSPTKYGFTELKSACCGLGNLRAQIACIPISEYCSNRNAHLFWDLYHPTEAAIRLTVDSLFDGTSQFSTPLNVDDLIAT